MKNIKLAIVIAAILFGTSAFADNQSTAVNAASTAGSTSVANTYGGQQNLNANTQLRAGDQAVSLRAGDMVLNQNSTSTGSKIPAQLPIPANIQLPTSSIFIPGTSHDMQFLRYSKLIAKFTRGPVSGAAYKDGKMMPKFDEISEFRTSFQPLGSFVAQDSDVLPDFNTEVYTIDDLLSMPAGTKHEVLGYVGVTVDKGSDFKDVAFLQSIYAVANTQVVEKGYLNGQGVVTPVFIIDTVGNHNGTGSESETLTIGVSAGMPAGGASGGINVGWGTNDNSATQEFRVTGRVVYLKESTTGRPIVDTLKAQKAADDRAVAEAKKAEAQKAAVAAPNAAIQAQVK